MFWIPNPVWTSDDMAKSDQIMRATMSKNYL